MQRIRSRSGCYGGVNYEILSGAMELQDLYESTTILLHVTEEKGRNVR